LFERTVGIVGCGGIGEALIKLLKPFHVTILGLTFSGRRVPGATISLGADGVDGLLERSDYVVIAAPLTPATRNLISRARFSLMRKTAWLINVSRGAVVDTAALVSALERGGIGGAAVDVVEPEPLPADHALWSLRNVLITPHTACSRELSLALFAVRLRENLRRFQKRKQLLGAIDLGKGY
jgi:phosphoglycerate dehydrogenase-like enzyme